MNRRPDWLRKLLAVALVLGTAAATRAGTITINPVNLSVNGMVENIGQIDANLNGDAMDATFTLSAAWIPLKKCVEFQWLQVVTSLVADARNPTYNMMALPIPIIDTPSGGYDGQMGEDALPWYLTPADIATHNLNGMNPNGSMFFKTSDTPSVKGATFDTWIVATTAAKEFCVLAGFEWGSGTSGGIATLKAKNVNGFPIAANMATIGTALTNGAFAGYMPMRDCNIVCMVPEPTAVVLLFVAVVGTGAVGRTRQQAA